ncbi:MAG TPA: glycosyltransferase [Flavobacterium sp.]|nr:glycosyltransferase [Flavobacterium sp.]
MINLFFVILDYSGARTYADELLSYMVTQQDIAVHKVYLNSSYFKEYTTIKEGNMTVIHLPKIEFEFTSGKKYAKRCIDLMSPFLEEKQNIFFHLNYRKQVYLGDEARKRFGAHLIYTLHFLPNYFSYWASEKFSGDLITTGDETEKQIIREADHVICVTRFAKESILKWLNISEAKVTAVHNGIGERKNQFRPLRLQKKEQVKEQLGFTKGEQLILYVGKLETRKGIKHLVTVFNRLLSKVHNARLIIAGDGNFDDVFNYAKGCWSKITLMGKIPIEEVFLLYQIADIGVIPSIFEQCSYVALEMMQYGLPVVVTAAPGLKELYTHKENALVAPLGDPDNATMNLEVLEDEFEKMILWLLYDKKLRKKIGKNSFYNWFTNHTSKHMGQATKMIYAQLNEINTQ